MPTYDYRCEACRHEFDLFQSITADAIKTCPECGEDKCRRLIGSGAGIIFKGSGFYETDYKRARTSGGKSGSGSGDKKSDSSSSADSGSTKSSSESSSSSGGSSSSGSDSGSKSSD